MKNTTVYKPPKKIKGRSAKAKVADEFHVIIERQLWRDNIIPAHNDAIRHAMIYGGSSYFMIEPGRWHEFDPKTNTIKPSFKRISLRTDLVQR